MSQILSFLTICVLLSLLSSTPGCAPREVHRFTEEEEQKNNALLEVAKVISGDTIELKDGRIIQYAGVKAPKENEPFFEKSLRANEWLIQRGRRRVFLEILNEDGGKYLAYVHAPTHFVYYCFINKELLENGFVTTDLNKHKIRYADEFVALEEKARNQKSGLWAYK